MDIVFKNAGLAKTLAEESKLVREFGARRATKIRVRLKSIADADSLMEFHPSRTRAGRCHELAGDRRGQFAMDLDHPARLVFEPANAPPPLKPDGGWDYERVTAVRILEIVDYHD